jgi:hypothetical protein
MAKLTIVSFCLYKIASSSPLSRAHSRTSKDIDDDILFSPPDDGSGENISDIHNAEL